MRIENLINEFMGILTRKLAMAVRLEDDYRSKKQMIMSEIDTVEDLKLKWYWRGKRVAYQEMRTLFENIAKKYLKK